MYLYMGKISRSNNNERVAPDDRLSLSLSIARRNNINFVLLPFMFPIPYMKSID